MMLVEIEVGTWLQLGFDYVRAPIVGIVFSLFLFGTLNVGLTGAIWKAAIKTDLTNISAYGILLFIALLLVSVPPFIVSYSLFKPNHGDHTARA